MEIAIVNNPRFLEVKESSTMAKSTFDDLVTQVLDGAILTIGDEEVSIREFVIMGDFLFTCQEMQIKFLCGNTAILEQINAKMKERIELKLLDALADFDIDVVKTNG